MKMFGGAQKDTKAPVPVAQNAKAKFFEDMAKSQVAAPSAAPMPTQREQAMKMFGGAQKEAKSTAPPPRTQNAKAKFFEDMAKQQAQAAAPSGPPVPTQREQAIKAFGANFRKA